MKLCADILYWRLKEKLTTVTLRGKTGSELALNRPEFYLDRTQSFEKTGCMSAPRTICPKVPASGITYAWCAWDSAGNSTPVTTGAA